MTGQTHQTVRLEKGRHAAPTRGVCVLELASMLAGDRFSDQPRSVCPVIAAFLRAYNDWIDDERRQDLHRFASAAVGTRGSSEVQEARLRLCDQWCREQQSKLHPRRSRLRALIGMPVAVRTIPFPATTAGWLSARVVAAGRAGAHEAAQEFVGRLIACAGPPSRIPTDMSVEGAPIAAQDEFDPQWTPVERSLVLTITQNAVDAVNLVAPGDAALRIYLPEASGGEPAPGLRLEVVEAPRTDDRVVDVDGTRVFLEPAAAEALDDMVLDAASDGEKVRFAVAPQGERPAGS
jgi:Fe-S cluster assembly iron-binding protein IscA